MHAELLVLIRQLHELILLRLVSVDEVLVLVTSDSSGEGHVLFHDRHSVRMKTTKIGILKKGNRVSFCRLLECN